MITMYICSVSHVTQNTAVQVNGSTEFVRELYLTNNSSVKSSLVTADLVFGRYRRVVGTANQDPVVQNKWQNIKLQNIQPAYLQTLIT